MSKMGDEYNKRLEKYAPDLLASLKELTDKMSPPDEYLCYLPELVRAREAIALVEGKL